MPQRIQAPDGSFVEFPDGMADDQIAAVMAREYGGPQQPRKTSQSLGFMKGVAKPLENFRKVNPLNVFDSPQYRETMARATEGMHNYFADREKTERPGIIGEVAGNIVGTLPVTMATRNPFVAGAAQGALLTDAETPAGVAFDAGVGGALNWAGGQVLDAVADTVKPVINPAVQRLKDAGVKMTPGMVKGGKAMVREDKLMSKPVVGDAIAAGRQRTLETFNVAAVDEALKPLGVRTPNGVKPGHDAVAFAEKEVEKAYSRVVPNLAVSLNPPQFIQSIAPIAQKVPPKQFKELQRQLSLNLGNGQVGGQALKEAHGEFRRLAREYLQSQKPADKALGRAFDAVDDELTAAMMAQNPRFASELQKVNAAYRGVRIVSDAASRADEGIASTSQLRQAVRRGDWSKDKRATAQGKAFMQGFSRDARKVIPARTPDSGTAGRLNAQNIFAQMQGLASRAGYEIDEALQNFRLAPRPAPARKAARVIRRAKPVAGAGAVAIGSRAND